MAYLENELEESQRATFEGHIDACPPCGVYPSTYEETIRMGQLACGERDEVPEEAPEQLIAAILAARGAS